MKKVTLTNDDSSFLGLDGKLKQWSLKVTYNGIVK